MTHWEEKSHKSRQKKKKIRQPPFPTIRGSTRTPSYVTITHYVEGLSQIHAGSLVLRSVFVSPHGPRLVDSEFSCSVLVPSDFYNPSTPLLQDSLSSA